MTSCSIQTRTVASPCIGLKTSFNCICVFFFVSFFSFSSFAFFSNFLALLLLVNLLLLKLLLLNLNVLVHFILRFFPLILGHGGLRLTNLRLRKRRGGQSWWWTVRWLDSAVLGPAPIECRCSPCDAHAGRGPHNSDSAMFRRRWRRARPRRRRPRWRRPLRAGGLGKHGVGGRQIVLLCGLALRLRLRLCLDVLHNRLTSRAPYPHRAVVGRGDEPCP
mmetsp:Transcript_145906/g.467682  ORF Transcript_145906/g.467682 Transcript_145906/m.467682 type:complete len:219 (-) Transcript_145906:1232-1888(-)